MMLNSFFKHLQDQYPNKIIQDIGWYLGYDGRANLPDTTGLYAPLMRSGFFELPPSSFTLRSYNSIPAFRPDGEMRLKLTFIISSGFNPEYSTEGLIVNEMGIGYGPTDLLTRVIIEAPDGDPAGVQLNPNEYLMTKFNIRFKFSQTSTINSVMIGATNYGGRLLFFKDVPVGFSQPLLEPCGVHGSAIIATNNPPTAAPEDMFVLGYDNLLQSHSPHPNDYYASRGFVLTEQEGNFPGGISAIYLRLGRDGNPCAVLALDTPIPKTNLKKLNMPRLINTRWSVNNVS